MRLEFHRQIASDISRITDYYENVAGIKLADEFYSELRFFFQKASEFPEAYETHERDLRRVNLEKFPYHFLFHSRRAGTSSGCSASPETPIAGPSPSMKT